ncbi:MAG: transporter [Xanthomonadales bacterium]|nr:transporter [Xanthomonadales bacterium]
MGTAGWLIALALCGSGPALGATCSCAGTPLLTAIDTSAREKGQLFISYVTEDHRISDLVSGSRDVRDETGRDRESFSQVVSASYALTDRWAVSALVSHIEHRRTIRSSQLGETRTSGIGDSVILARYTPIVITPFNRHEWALGLGLRIPSADDDLADGFILSEDMQPSTGARGTILWTGYTYAFNQAATVVFNATANYTDNQSNDRQYAFGDEVSLFAGVGHNMGPRFSYSVGLRYRRTDADSRGKFDIPNTGGEWLDFVPAVQWSLTDRLDLGLSGRIPIARDLNGALQFTTSYSYGFSLSYGF